MRSGGPKSPQGGREPPGTGSPGGEAGAAPAHLAGSAPWRRLLLAGQGTGDWGGEAGVPFRGLHSVLFPEGSGPAGARCTGLLPCCRRVRVTFSSR